MLEHLLEHLHAHYVVYYFSLFHNDVEHAPHAHTLLFANTHLLRASKWMWFRLSSLARLGLFKSANDAKSRFIHKVRADTQSHRREEFVRPTTDTVGLEWGQANLCTENTIRLPLLVDSTSRVQLSPLSQPVVRWRHKLIPADCELP